MLLALAAVGAAVPVLGWHLKFETVLSGSMRPHIQPGDVAVLRPVSASSIRVGEVVAYLPPGQSLPVLHRIVSITPAGFLTKGDANNAPDVWGRVKPSGTSVDQLVFTVPKVGLVRDAKAPVILGGLVLLLAALTGACWPRRRRDDRDRTTSGVDRAADRATEIEPCATAPAASQPGRDAAPIPAERVKE